MTSRTRRSRLSSDLVFIVPVYNEQPGDVLTSIDSIKALDCRTHIVVVDDCSVTPIEPMEGVETLWHTTNGGPQGALNTGIQYVRQRWGDVPVSRLDVGDTVLAERAHQLEWMLSNDHRAVFADHWDRASDTPFRVATAWDWNIYRDCQFTLLSAIWFASVGLFDPALPYAHDWDFCLKVQASTGWRRYPGGPTVRCGMMPGGYTAQAFADKARRRKRDACVAEVCARARSLRPRGPRLC